MLTVVKGGKASDEAVDYIAQNHHFSPLEFIVFVFKIEGVSRACVQQVTRHRLAAYLQKSQRFTDGSNFEYVTPDSIYGNEQALKLYNQTMDKIAIAYSALVSMGIPHEDARSILPNACHTELYARFDLRSLMNFCNQRLCMKAQEEIRRLAEEMKARVYEVSPQFANMLQPNCITNGKCFESNGCKNGK